MGAELGKPSGPRPEVLQTLETASDGDYRLKFKEVETPSLGLNCLLCSVKSEREERNGMCSEPASEDVSPKQPKRKGNKEVRYTGPSSASAGAGGGAGANYASKAQEASKSARETAEEAVRREAGRLDRLNELESGSSAPGSSSADSVRQQRAKLEAMHIKRILLPSQASQTQL